MNKLNQTQFIPLILLLIKNGKIKLNVDTKKYKRIDSRLIFTRKYFKNLSYIKETIDPILIRFCSIHNELGDTFTIREGDNLEDYDLIKLLSFP